MQHQVAFRIVPMSFNLLHSPHLPLCLTSHVTPYMSPCALVHTTVYPYVPTAYPSVHPIYTNGAAVGAIPCAVCVPTFLPLHTFTCPYIPHCASLCAPTCPYMFHQCALYFCMCLLCALLHITRRSPYMPFCMPLSASISSVLQ